MDCEFCSQRARYRFKYGEYERFVCGRHVAWGRRLVFLDYGQVSYEFGPV